MTRGYRLCGAARGSLSVADVIEHVAFEFGLAPETIVAGNNRRYLAEARYAITLLAQLHTQMTHADVAAALKRPAGTAARLARNGRLFREASADFSQRVDQIGEMLIACSADAA